MCLTQAKPDSTTTSSGRGRGSIKNNTTVGYRETGVRENINSVLHNEIIEFVSDPKFP